MPVSAGLAVLAAAALVFFECFLAGVAEASGVGLGVVSAARTKGVAANTVITIIAMSERMGGLLRIDACIWQVFQSFTLTE